MSDAFVDSTKTFKKASAGVTTVSGSLSTLGIDSDMMVTASGYVSVLGGLGIVASGFKTLVDAYTAYKAAEAAANIAMYGIGAIAVAGIAAAAGYAMSELITNSTSKVSSGDYESSEGLRQLARDVNG
jgi:hypothetical protein